VICAKNDDALLPLSVVHLCIICYAFSYWFCQPVEPYLLKKLGGDKMTWGYVQSLYNACMLVGSPIVGRMCDVCGVKIGGITTLIAGALSYLLMACAWNLPSFYLSKLPTVFLATMQVSQTIVAHLSDTESRSEALGRLSVSYGIGMVFGAFTGGFFGERFGYQANPVVACCVSLSLIPMFLCFVPSQILVKEDDEDSGGLQMSVICKLLTIPRVASLVCTCILLSVGLGLHRNTFPNVMLYHFKLDPSDQGVVISAGAVCAVLANVFLIGPSVRCVGERWLLLSMMLVILVCVLVYTMATASNLWLFYALIVPKAIAAAMVMTVIASLFTRITPLEQVGTAVAIMHSIATLSGIGLPLLGNYIFMAYGFVLVCLCSAAMLGIAIIHGFFAEGIRDFTGAEGDESRHLSSGDGPSV